MKLRKRRIIETLAAFIAGGWLLVEVVERLLVSHYRFPDKTIDITVVSIVGALLCTLIWRWFSGTEKRPGNIKLEVLLVPVVILFTLAIDLNLIFGIAGISGKGWLIGLIALCFGIGWTILKLSQWAAITPESGKKEAGLSIPAAAKPEKSIAVLPFSDLSPQKDQEYFCDGMTEEIITALSKIRSLRVISRNSVMTLKGTQKTTREISELLNVGHVLEGSVRKAGNDLRIAAQLIDASTDGHLWAERYAGTLNDVFDIQEKVALAITDALKMKLSPKDEERLTERLISDSRVLDCYYRAYQEISLITKESFERGLRLLQLGLETLGGHPLLYKALAQAHYFAIEGALEPREEALRKAAEFTRCLEGSDPRYTHALLAEREYLSGSIVKAICHFEDAVAANPSDRDLLLHLAWNYSFDAGKPAAGAAVAERVISIDPLTVFNLFARAGSFYADAKFAQALAVYDEMLRREPRMQWVNVFRMIMLAGLGRMGEACSLAGEVTEGVPALQAIALKHALLGEREPFLALMTGELESFCWDDPECPEMVAGWFALVGERDRALDWLEHWVDRGAINYPMLAQGDPFFPSLRGDPRFQRLLERIRPEWERFVPRFQPGA